MKRLLIPSVSAGAGHKRAAEALEEAARRRWPSKEIRLVGSHAGATKRFGNGRSDILC